ncbi:hypothetical protein HY416_03650 [Candidatus Kaiserbacteria bacterium]|nr:hypothetical protein [Candidatus Kaiserbacteria bacterium]
MNRIHTISISGLFFALVLLLPAVSSAQAPILPTDPLVVLQKTVDDLKAEFDTAKQSLEDQIRVLGDENKVLTDRIVELEKQVGGLKTGQDEAAGRLDVIETTHDQLEVRVEVVEEGLGNAEGRIDPLEAAKTQFETEIADLQEADKGFDRQFTSFKEEAGDLEDLFRRWFSDLFDRVEKSEESLREKGITIENLINVARQLEKDRDLFKQQFTSVEKSLTALGRDIDQARKDLVKSIQDAAVQLRREAEQMKESLGRSIAEAMAVARRAQGRASGQAVGN